MRLLTRYVIREIVPPTLIGFGFYTFVIVMRALFDLAEMIVRESLPTSAVLELLLLSLPHIVVLTLPMSLLVGILIAIGRLSSDSEIIAMRSAGIPASAIYRPVFIFSVAMFAITLWLINIVMPRTNSLQQQREAELVSAAATTNIKPRVFFDRFENYVIYVDDVAPDGSFRGVFISDRSGATGGREELVTVAESGRLTFVPSTRQLWLELEGSVTHSSSPGNPEDYDLITSGVQKLLLVDEASRTVNMASNKPYRSMNFGELLAARAAARHPIDVNSVSVEIHKKLAIPFACIAFGIVALPLGITNRRGGRSGGFSLSVGLILIYYILLNTGEDMARNARVPGAIVWLPNLLMILLGLWLIRRANRDAGAASGFADRIAVAFQRMRGARGPSRDLAEATNRGSLLDRIDLPFPTILDRYVVSQFVRMLVLVLVSTLALFIIVDYAERAGDISENDVPIGIIVNFFAWYSVQILNWMLPLSVLLATLITFGLLAKTNEVTAIKSSGTSLYRLSVPVIAIAGMVALASYALEDYILPYSNERVAQLEARIEGNVNPASGFGRDQRQWLFGRGRHLFHFLSYDRNNQSLERIQVFEFHPQRFRLSRRVLADRARWDGTGWVFENGWIRSFGDDGGTSYSPLSKPLRLHYDEPPEFFASEAKTPEQMSFGELRRYIEELRQSGYLAAGLEVNLYSKTSWPFISLVMALIALPFAFRMGRRGAMHGVGIAMALAFAYWILFGFFTKFGEAGSLPPLLAAWSANILFAIAAVWMFLKVET